MEQFLSEQAKAEGRFYALSAADKVRALFDAVQRGDNGDAENVLVLGADYSAVNEAGESAMVVARRLYKKQRRRWEKDDARRVVESLEAFEREGITGEHFSGARRWLRQQRKESAQKRIIAAAGGDKAVGEDWRMNYFGSDAEGRLHMHCYSSTSWRVREYAPDFFADEGNLFHVRGGGGWCCVGAATPTLSYYCHSLSETLASIAAIRRWDEDRMEVDWRALA